MSLAVLITGGELDQTIEVSGVIRKKKGWTKGGWRTGGSEGDGWKTPVVFVKTGVTRGRGNTRPKRNRPRRGGVQKRGHRGRGCRVSKGKYI